MDISEEVIGEAVSRETWESLSAYRSLLEKWNPKINLVARSTIADADARHFADSAQLARHRSNAASWVDLGSGGGFPGLVLAILFREIAPQIRMTLVESDRRKAAFLRQAARIADVDVEVLDERIEHIENRRFDMVSARAVAPLVRLLSMAADLVEPSGRCVFLKGARYETELDEARKEWQFDCSSIPSVTQGGATVLLIESLRRV